MPSTSASITSRPPAPRRSASASTAEATGPAGWMIVFRWVSSKSKVCEVMPLTSAALAMSTCSARPSTLACGAGSSIRTAASAASAASCRAAPMAQPSQLKKVRCASCSTASLQPRDGWPATNFARIAVIGGAVGVGGDVGVAGHRGLSVDARASGAGALTRRGGCCGPWRARSSARCPSGCTGRTARASSARARPLRSPACRPGRAPSAPPPGSR